MTHIGEVDGKVGTIYSESDDEVAHNRWIEVVSVDYDIVGRVGDAWNVAMTHQP